MREMRENISIWYGRWNKVEAQSELRRRCSRLDSITESLCISHHGSPKSHDGSEQRVTRRQKIFLVRE